VSAIAPPRRPGVRYPKFADKFARLDFEADPLPVIALYPIPEPVALHDLEIDVAGLNCRRQAVPGRLAPSCPDTRCASH
jgi:hypothetical protein